MDVDSNPEMHKISLVCSAHRENGRCNSEELLKILRAIGPDVIFEEIRPSDFDANYRANTRLEVRAITRFRETRPINQVPVDGYNDNESTLEMKASIDRVFDCMEQSSQAYRDLQEELARLTYLKGFEYLNSEEFLTTSEEIKAIENQVIKATGNPDLIRGLQWWRDVLKRRDAEMIRNIYGYCQNHAFETGVFLVGAAHKANIVKAIKERDGAGSDLIDWTFTYVWPD